MRLLDTHRGQHILQLTLRLLLHHALVPADGKRPLLKQLLQLITAVLLPIDCVGVLDHPHGSACVDQAPMSVMSTRLDNVFLVPFGRSAFHRRHKSCAHPHGISSKRERHGQTSAIIDATGGNHWHRLTCQRRHPTLAQINNHWNQNARCHFPCMATALTSLCTNNVNAGCKCLLNMVWRSNHVHDRNASCMQLVDHVFWGHAHCTHEELCAHLNGDVNQLGQVALCVIIICLARPTTDLWQQQVNAEGCIRNLQVVLQLLDLRSEELRSVVHPSKHSQATCIRNCGC
mmetsp:Transcript_133079/g.332192  ORF Transcript_133079/g.332192 Transcript_133079/m.332192 type:complete len:288 (+) Transcript_133079:268-1131(+)